MFFNFIKSTLRSIFNDRLNSIINLFGLSVGLACSVLIYLYVKNELSFDQFHENYQQIYHVYTINPREGQDQPKAATSMLLGPEMVGSLPEVEKYVRFTNAPGKV